jgi:CRP-like cAMP-binding protein
MSAPRGRPRPGVNRLVALLPPDSRERLLAHAQPVQLGLGHVVWPQDHSITALFLPTTAVFSLVVRMDDGRGVEAAPVGFEGAVGTALLLGESRSPCEVVIQGAGHALRIPAPTALRLAAEDPAIRDVLLRSAQVQMVQASRSAACNRLHPVEERLARWLLHMHDWIWAEELHLTHEFLAIMLGVRRASVTVAAGILQQAGLIGYQRGAITVLDRTKLEDVACEDYFAVRDAFERLLPLPPG